MGSKERYSAHEAGHRWLAVQFDSDVSAPACGDATHRAGIS